MPSTPSVHTSSAFRLPNLQAASTANKQQYAGALPAAPSHGSSPAESERWTLPAAEELPPATIACLKVLDKILLEASGGAAGAVDPGENHYGEERSTQFAGGDRTLCGKNQNAGRDAENKTELMFRGSSTPSKRRSDPSVTHAEVTFAAADDSVGESERARNNEQDINGSSRGLETRRRRLVTSYRCIFKLLHTAGVLNTLPKCLHMLHAICIHADQQRQTDPPGAASDLTNRPGTASRSPKKRKLPVDRSVVEAGGLAVRAHDWDERLSGTCDANTESGDLVGQREKRSLLSAAPLSPEHVVVKDADGDESVLCNFDCGGSSSCEAHPESLPTDCEPSVMCCSDWEHTQGFSCNTQQTPHSPVYRHSRTAHIAGLVLGYIEALGSPPPLTDPGFHDKIVHVLCRLFYTRHPLEGKHNTAYEASTQTPGLRDSHGSSDAAVNGSALSIKKSAGGIDEVNNPIADACGEGRCSLHTFSYEGIQLPPLTPHEWRQQIIARFDTVERLLLCSVPTLFRGEAAPATPQETLRTVAANAGSAVRSVNAATEVEVFKVSPNSGDFACSTGEKGTAECRRGIERSGVVKPDGHSGSDWKCATSAAVLVKGRERCRRALRLVRHWVAFLLELEQERQNLIKRVLQASEEVQGLPRMLLEETSESEQEVQQIQQPNLGKATNSGSSGRTTKRRSLLILRVSNEDDTVQEPQKCGLDKKPASTAGRAGLHLEEMETRIRATQQLLLLPSMPPFTHPEVEAVHAARARFERCLLRWREAQDRRRQDEEEARRKAAAAAAAVLYVTDRMREQQQAQMEANSAPPGTAASAMALLRQRSISHAFYLLGLNPQTATLQMVEQVRKKWRVLLHPDKFVSVHSHLLQQATEAFKAFHVAVTEANRLLSQRRVEPSWSPPPPPPDLTSGGHSASAGAPALGVAEVHARADRQHAPVKSTADAATAAAACGDSSHQETHKSCCPLPTHQFFPDFTVHVSRDKKKACTGGLILHVHAAPSREGEWPFTVIKEIRIFVLRPTLSEGPVWKLLLSTADVCLLIRKSVELQCVSPTATGGPSASLVHADKNSTCPTNKVEIDALQPVELGVEKVYWVGVQVEGLRKSQSLVAWKPVTVRLVLPGDTDSKTPAHLSDSGSGSAAVEWDATADEESANFRSLAAASRALLAFLQTFTEASFVKQDCSFNNRLRDAVASLKRVLRQQKKSKRSEHAHTCRQDIEEWKWVEDEAKQVLRECMERAKTWESEQNKETKPSATA